MNSAQSQRVNRRLRPEGNFVYGLFDAVVHLKCLINAAVIGKVNPSFRLRDLIRSRQIRFPLNDRKSRKALLLTACRDDIQQP